MTQARQHDVIFATFRFITPTFALIKRLHPKITIVFKITSGRSTDSSRTLARGLGAF